MSARAGACHQRIVKSMQRPYRASSVGHRAAMHASNHVSISKNTCKQSHEKHYARMHDRTPAKRLTNPPLAMPIASASNRSSPSPAPATGHRIRQPQPGPRPPATGFARPSNQLMYIKSKNPTHASVVWGIIVCFPYISYIKLASLLTTCGSTICLSPPSQPTFDGWCAPVVEHCLPARCEAVSAPVAHVQVNPKSIPDHVQQGWCVEYPKSATKRQAC